MTPGNILLIDNDPCLLNLLTLVLEQEGYSVRNFTSAEEALRRGPGAADLAILDYRLPGMDGLALLQRLRRRHPELPALIISSECRADALPAGSGLPVTRLLHKPFVYATFMESVANLLKKGAEV